MSSARPESTLEFTDLAGLKSINILKKGRDATCGGSVGRKERENSRNASLASRTAREGWRRPFLAPKS